MTLTLKGRILVIATAVMLCAIGAVIASNIGAFTREYESALQSRSMAIGKGLTTQLERLLQFGIGIDKLVGFDEQCQQVVETYAGLDLAMVVGPDGRILFHSAGQATEPLVSDPALRAAVQRGSEAVITSDVAGVERYYTIIPVRNLQGDLLGGVVIGFSAEEIHRKLHDMVGMAVPVGVLLLAAGLVVLYLSLAAFVTKPLASLIGTIVKLRECPSDLGRRTPVRSNDELGRLGQAFNDLMRDLQETTVSKSALQDAMDELTRTSDALFEQKESAEVTLRSIADAVITSDADDRVRYMNPVAEQITGWTLSDAEGRPLEEVVVLVDSVTDEPVRLGHGQAGARSRETIGREIDLVRTDGERVGVNHSAAPMRNRQGGLAGSVLTFRDVSAERSFAKRRTWEASHDVLTGLANRREFERRIEAALETARTDGKTHVVCFMDLDRFKLVNDTCGHAAGDELLKCVTELMRSKVRESDTLARLGGDEFALLLDGCGIEHGQRIAADLLAAVRDYRFDWKSKTLNVGVSVGLATMGGETTAAEVMSMADTACYWAKEQGRDRVCVYSTGDGDMAARRRETSWVTRINAALAQDRFVLYHQSYLALNPELRGRMHVEVLLRMIDEEGQLVQPGSFLPAAERYNLMPAIDRWVIRRVFEGYHALREERGGKPLTCAVNLSGTSLNSEGLIEFIRQHAIANDLPAQSICFEITETAAINNLRHAAEFIRECKAMGFQFALDDFGTGTSSFGYLKNLAVDYLKIDGGFVKNIERDRVDRAMTETINHVGHILGIRTVAEYAENETIIKQLRGMGVDYAQGFGVAAPSPLFAEATLESQH
jgi:diguanylate cyclase (GGDEF)-like protein/PAS domain S-box-containing protein